MKPTSPAPQPNRFDRIHQDGDEASQPHHKQIGGEGLILCFLLRRLDRHPTRRSCWHGQRSRLAMRISQTQCSIRCKDLRTSEVPNIVRKSQIGGALGTVFDVVRRNARTGRRRDPQRNRCVSAALAALRFSWTNAHCERTFGTAADFESGSRPGICILSSSRPSTATARNPMSSTTLPTSRAPVFSATNVSKTYDMGEVKVEALRGVDLELFPGEFVVLLGPSGSGKSTLLNILGGLDVPTSGVVQYEDKEITAFNDVALTRYRREHVGFVFQFYNLIPSLTAKENVALITEISRDPMKPEDALKLVDLGDRMDHFPAQLSGGEQQRVAIARAIAKRPEVLLCDEPTGALDINTGIVVLQVIERINRELGTTTAVITHNAAIADMAHRVIQLADGRVKEVTQNAHRKQASELSW